MNNRNSMYYFIVVIIVQVLLHYLIQHFFSQNIYMYLLGELIFNILIAYLFAFLNYRGYRKEMWKDPNFHKSFGIYFLIFVALDVLLFFL